MPIWRSSLRKLYWDVPLRYQPDLQVQYTGFTPFSFSTSVLVLTCIGCGSPIHGTPINVLSEGRSVFQLHSHLQYTENDWIQRWGTLTLNAGINFCKSVGMRGTRTNAGWDHTIFSEADAIIPTEPQRLPIAQYTVCPRIKETGFLCRNFLS